MRSFIATACFVFFINFFIYHAIGPLAVFCILIALLFYIFAVHGRMGNVLSVWSRAMIAVALVSSSLVVMRASPTVQIVGVFASLVSQMLLLYFLTAGGGVFFGLSEVVLLPFRLIVPYISAAFIGWGHVIGSQKTAKGPARSLFVGLMIGLPVALFLVGLLSGADPIFAHTTRTLFSEHVLRRLLTHMFVSCVVFAGLLPVGYMVMHRMGRSPAVFLSRLGFATEMTVVSFLVAVVMGGFLFIQWPYVFARVAAEVDLSRFGVATYSEYVNRGFGEFLFIATVLYIIAWAGLFALRAKGKQPLLGIVQTIVLTEFGVFILSLFRRVWLYVQYHGLSLSRVYGTFFLMVVTLLFVALALRHIWSKVRWVMVEMIGIVFIFVLFASVNTEHLIATWLPPTVNGRVDTIYLSRLSSDGYIGWQKAYEYTQATLNTARYDKKALLEERDREAIDYAGFILVQLTRQYDRLIRRYGSVDDLNLYAEALFAFQTEMNGKTVQSSVNLSDIVSRVSVGYVSLEYPLGTGVPATFYHVTDSTYVRRMDYLDRLYAWNWSEKRSFDRMKIDMPYTDLLGLQREYFGLARRIAAQKESDQGYKRDVSFDGPFLMPL